ncbi:uncharacterized protein K452DRAFT_51263 [Aplosporella prunicola CBS 121167]|uniref:Uncharacterized protein n=1 Tax=Aplosporella prunicola CBS 121167 TaxID=1176127 RepID=A0A6A6BD19_9PEZI|nr:uncharacterized protein K452DRAFT_51263 [Aplosporella prunicola CBS 121167]KAF2140797.1 hypothetical protein K452DRAFT_51263 [Aplosporella prunicola CBS 121167]
MHPKARDTKTLSLPGRRKHRVRKGVADVLGALGLRGAGEEGRAMQPKALDLFHAVNTGSLPAGSVTSTPSLVSRSANEDLSDTQSSHSTDPDMSILSNLKKAHHKSAPAPTSNPRPQQKPSQPTPKRTTSVPSAKNEPDRMSVNSIPATLVSDTTIAQEDSTLGMLNKAKASVRNKSPPPRSRQSTTVHDAVRSLRIKLEEEIKSSNDAWLATGLAIEGFLNYIGAERLRRMPAKGSRWDKILKWAEDFAITLSLFEEAVESTIASSKEAVELILGCLQLLLQLGPSQGVAMERAFSIFHEYGLIFGFYIKNYGLLRSIPETRQEMSFALADMVNLVVEITVHYRKSIRTMSAEMVTVDFTITFGSQMESFILRRDRITDHMWTYQLKHSPEITEIQVSIESIRQWLLPQDRTLQALSTRRGAARASRAEFTCEWFDRCLIDFFRSRDGVLTVSAETGAGKTALHGWILERLQRPVSRRTYSAVGASISTQTPALATQINLIKELLVQLLDQNVGNVALYRCLANVLELDSNTTSEADAEDALWYTLETAIKPCKNIVLVIDGLDALQGEEVDKLEAFERLHDIASKNKNVRVIVLTRPFAVPFPKPTRQVVMDSERTAEDVKHITRAFLQTRGFTNPHEIDEVVEEVAQRSKGSLTWTDMTLQLMQKEASVPDMLNAAKQVPSTLAEVLDKHISTLSLKGDARLMLGWLLVADRPLTTAEVQTLLELNIQKGTHQPRPTNIVEDIQRSCGPLVTVQDKTVRFRNESVRQHLLNLSKEGKQLLSPAEAHRDLTTRLLLYNKVCVTRNTEPSLDKLPRKEVASLFQSNPLLEYSARNWVKHFKLSPFFAEGQPQPATPELKSVFPNSTVLPLLEKNCWDKQALTSKVNDLHVLALRIRQNALGENNRAVMQNAINVAQSCEKRKSPIEASKYYHQAAKLGQSVLGKSNDLAVACAAASVNCTEGIEQKTRTEDVARREEMLRYIVDTGKQQQGAASDLAAKYKTKLAQLYTDIQENEKAEDIYREMYQTTVKQHGEFSREANTASAKLRTVLVKEDRHEDIVQYTQPIFETAERNLEIFDIRRVEITLRMAETYEEKQDLVRAEELYIALWRGLSDHCRTHAAAADAHERKVQISLAYANFLKRHNRQAEAENILHGVWLDYQHRDNKSDGLVKQLKHVGEELSAMGILETAISVFKNIWGHFKSNGKQTSAEAVATAVALADTVQRKAESMKAKKEAARAVAGPDVIEDDIDISDDEGDEEADGIMDEVVEAAIAAHTVPAAPKPGEVAESKETALETCEKLSLFYMSKGRWTDAVNVLHKTLLKLWPNLGIEGKYGFPKSYTAEAIKLARRLALCHTESNQTEQAEKIYAFLFHSARSSLSIQDELVVETSNDLIAFYERTKQYIKILQIHELLLESYRTALGSRNPLTIKTLYTMGDLCLKYHIKGADRYYFEVVKALKDNTGVLSKESLPASLKLSKIYYEQKRWQEARVVYASLWATFTKHGKEYGITPETAQVLYRRYVTILDTHLKVDSEETRRLAIEYRDTCHEVYGPDHVITIHANLQLAEVYRNSPEHHEEALKICETVVAKVNETPEKARSASQLTIIATAKRHLAALYSAQAKTTPESTDKAVTLWKEQFEAHKKQHGPSGKVTLATLAALAAAYSKSDKPELHSAANKQLQSATVEVLTTEKDSTKLFDSAVALAKTFNACKYTEQGWALLRELRRQIIAKETRATHKYNVPLPDSVDRRSLVFVAAFEGTLRDEENKGGFSDVMTDLLTESILHDRYQLSFNQKNISPEIKLFDGARLYTFLKGKEQSAEQCVAVENALYGLFIEQAGANIKTSPEATRAFLITVLEELSRYSHHEDLTVVACIAGTSKVRALLEREQFVQAYEIALCLYQFVSSRGGFKDPKNIASSFKLSLYLAGLGVPKTNDFKLQARMVELSTTVLRETLAACKSQNIDLVQLQASELNNLVRLMGEQKNYIDLEVSLPQFQPL